MESKEEYDYLFKAVLVGEAETGKTCLMKRFTDDLFAESYLSTIGVDFSIKSLIMDDKVVKAQIWDTAGQERFRTITTSYYRGSHGALVVFSITDRASFDNCEDYIKNIRAYGSEETPIVLVGNKCDRKAERKVTKEEAQKFADGNGIQYIETSAKTSENVEQAFITVFQECKKNSKSTHSPPQKMDAPPLLSPEDDKKPVDDVASVSVQDIPEWALELAHALEDVVKKMDVVDKLEATVADLSKRLESVEEKVARFDSRKVDFKSALAKSTKS